MIGAVLVCFVAAASPAPSPSPSPPSASASSSDTEDVEHPAAKGAAIVDLNVASPDELCTLPGIGPKKAEAIIALRQKRPFTRVTQLLQVKGIGPKTLEKLKPKVTLTQPKLVPKPSSKPAPPTSTTPAPSSEPPLAALP